MKKAKFITGLSAAFVTAMALMSCTSLIKARGGVILTINGVEYRAEDLFKDQKTPAAAEAKFNAVYKVAVRNYFTNGDGKKEMDEITNNTKIKISEQKATAQSNAATNGTTFAVEWQKILDSNNVDNEAGLYDKFEYELQKDKFENNFYEEHYDELRDQEKVPEQERVFGAGFKDYFTNKQPYHMKHILVKIDGLGTNNTDGTISSTEAKKLYDVITELANGTPFESVSRSHSDDTAAKEAGGSLGIMSRDTSFVDDFKLGTYLYEAFYDKSTNATTEHQALYDSKVAKDKLFPSTAEGTAGGYAEKITTEVYDPTGGATSKTTIGVIPYEAALLLGDDHDGGYAEAEYNDFPILTQAGIGESDFNKKYLPRNVIFNKYFNKHNIMVIAPAKMPNKNLYYTTTYDGSGSHAGDGQIMQKDNGSYRLTQEDAGCLYDSAGYATLKGFTTPAKNKDELVIPTGSKILNAITADGQATSEQRILRDDNGRTIFVFRSGTGGSSTSNDDYQGIHFVVIERSPFIGIEYDGNEDVQGNKHSTTLDEYYTVSYPGQSGGHHPTYEDAEHLGQDKLTYANYIAYDELINKKERADKVKSELKNCMPNLNTFIYEYLLKNGTIEFNPKMITDYHIDIKQDIQDWIGINRKDSDHETEKNWNNNWQNYYYSLKAMTEQRQDIEVDTNHWDSRVVSELCIKALENDFTIEEENGTPIATEIEAIEHMFRVGGVFHE